MFRTSPCCPRTPTKGAIPNVRVHSTGLSFALSLTGVETTGRGACTREVQSACSLQLRGCELFDKDKVGPEESAQAPWVERRRPIGTSFEVVVPPP